MKNSSFVINGILAVAVVVLFVLHFSDKDSVSDQGSMASNEQLMPQNEGEVKVAYVLIDSLLAYYKMAQDLSEDLMKNKQNLEGSEGLDNFLGCSGKGEAIN
jgi:outer membrane protein